MGLFKKLLKQSKLPMPGGTAGKNSKGLKIGAALTFNNPGSLLDPEVLGARGSIKDLGRSVDQAKAKTISDANTVATEQKAAAAAAAAAAEEPFNLAKESQKKGLLRKGRRSSILTSTQGSSDPLGIPG